MAIRLEDASRAGAKVLVIQYRRGSISKRFPMWVGLALGLLGLVFLSLPGRYFADTHDVLWFAPGWYLRHSTAAWVSDPFVQGQPNLDVMVAVIALLRAIGFSVWVVQRLWYGLLLFLAAAGMVLLMDQLRGRRTVVGPLAAGLLYALTPYTFGYGLLVSAAFLPYVFLPWLLLVTARWLPSSSLVGPALFGLTVFAMGGGNGAPQALTFLPLVAYGLWVVLVERAIPGWRALRFAGLALVFVLALNAYWLASLAPRQVANALAYSEQPKAINVASSYSESIRGLGFWQYYGGDAFGSWIPAVRRYVTSPLFVVLGFGLPVAAFVTAWLLRRWRTRLLFLFLALAGAIGMSGLFPTNSLTPFGHALLFAYGHVPGAAGLRTTYKLAPVLSLSLAVLAAAGLEGAWGSLRGRAGWRISARALLGAGAVLLIAANSYPLWAGHLEPTRNARAIPAYWQSALRYLGGREEGYNAFFAPGALLMAYRWGGMIEGVAETDPSVPSILPWPFPTGRGYRTNMLAAVEEPYQHGLGGRSAPLFRYLGVKDVVLQNDVDWQRSQTAGPSDMQILVRDPSLANLTTFGMVGQNTTSPAETEAPDSIDGRLPPVQILTVPDPLPAIRAESGAPIVVSGDAFGIAALARQGFLEENPPVLYSGALTPAEVASLAGDNPTFVVTDTNRRAAHSFNAVQTNTSYTLPRGGRLGDRPIGFGLFDDRADTQSTAVYVGIRGVTASGFGSPFVDQPEYRPFAAFDRDPGSAWVVGAFGDPRGSWIRVDFDSPIDISRVRLVLPSLYGRRVNEARLEFSNGSSVDSRLEDQSTEVSFAPRRSAFLRVRIVGVTEGGLVNPVGFSEIQVPGVSARELVQAPDDLLHAGESSPVAARVIDSAPLVFLFQRDRRQSPSGTDPEAGISRLFEVPSTRPFDLEGKVHLNPSASRDSIDDFTGAANGPGTAARALPCTATRDVMLDGVPVAIRLTGGSVGDLLRGVSLHLTTCDGRPLTLEKGRHELVAHGALQPDVLVLASPRPEAARSEAPLTVVQSRGPSGFDVTIHSAKAPFYLVTGQDWSPAWTASIDGHSLGPPLVLDGYSAGWRVTRAGTFRISVRYGPQRLYTAFQILSAVALALTIGLVLILLIRRGRPT